MTEAQKPFDDDFGPDILDRVSGKFMGSGGSHGGGSYLDPSYEDALHILGKAHEMPPPFVQQALRMENPEAADLAQRLTTLRQAAGAGFGGSFFPAEQSDESHSVARQVQEFIDALQTKPPDRAILQTLYHAIARHDDEIRSALENVYAHQAVRPLFAVE